MFFLTHTPPPPSVDLRQLFPSDVTVSYWPTSNLLNKSTLCFIKLLKYNFIDKFCLYIDNVVFIFFNILILRISVNLNYFLIFHISEFSSRYIDMPTDSKKCITTGNSWFCILPRYSFFETTFKKIRLQCRYCCAFAI